MVSEAKVGVLALQGASVPQHAAFRRLGVASVDVRSRAELEGLTHLVLPGGESTTIRHLLDLFDMQTEIVTAWRAGRLSLLGVCAGAILLGRGPGKPARLGLLDVELERNAFGAQAHSFIDTLRVEPWNAALQALFIRAPRIRAVGPDARVLASWRGEPVLVEGPGLLAATFHPELSASLEVHRHFLARRLPGTWRESASLATRHR